VVTIYQNRGWYLRDRTDEEQRAWAEGQAMSVEQAVAYALKPESAARASA